MAVPRYDNPISATLDALRQARSGQAGRRAGPGRVDGPALVTGASRGLGRAIAEALAARGAEVVLASRSDTAEVGRHIHGRGGKARSEHVELADLRSVDALCDRLDRPLQVLVLNAAVVPRSSRRTAQGFDVQDGVNYLANVRLVDRLLATGRLRDGARVVVVSSESHRSAEALDPHALGRDASYGLGGVMRRYGYSKLLLTAWAGHLARELHPRVVVHTLCPGPVQSDIAREAPRLGRLLLAPLMRRFFAPPSVAAEPAVHLACADALAGQTGLYLHRWQTKDPAPPARDVDAARRLVEHSRRLLNERMAS